MNNSRRILLDEKQILQRINRLSYQVYEDNSTEKEIVIAGIYKSGYLFAERLAETLKKISPLQVILAQVNINKHSQGNQEISVSLKKEEMDGRVIILVDDVLNSGKTLMYAMKPFLAADIKKLRTVVLVDRSHKKFPVAADFTGLSLSTSHKEHVSVEIENGSATAWLS